MKGREYRGFVYVDARALTTRDELEYWVGLAMDYNQKAGARSADRKPRRRPPARKPQGGGKWS